MISDTHTLHNRLDIPDGDVLIHAGDMTNHGSLNDVDDFNRFLGTLPHRHKLVIAGNHDFCFQKVPDKAVTHLTNATYLQDSSVIIEGVHFYGSPWQPWFYDWAFQLHRGADIRAKWELIPPQTDVLITHGPPKGYGDLTVRGDYAGCQDLLDIIEQIHPQINVFGHIHEGYGISQNEYTTFVNASSLNLNYRIANAPVEMTIEPRIRPA